MITSASNRKRSSCLINQLKMSSIVNENKYDEIVVSLGEMLHKELEPLRNLQKVWMEIQAKWIAKQQEEIAPDVTESEESENEIIEPNSNLIVSPDCAPAVFVNKPRKTTASTASRIITYRRHVRQRSEGKKIRKKPNVTRRKPKNPFVFEPRHAMTTNSVNIQRNELLNCNLVTYRIDHQLNGRYVMNTFDEYWHPTAAVTS